MNSAKILVISHNVFSQTTGMGRTLSAYFSEYDSENLAQLYFHSEVPTSDICKNYFRITDSNVLKAYLKNKKSCGTPLYAEDIQLNRKSSRTDKGFVAKIYQFSRSRTPLIYYSRNTMWNHGNRSNSALNKWVDDFDPDVIFFASGDYNFSYKITSEIAKRKKIPVVISCMDDFYINYPGNSLLARHNHKALMKAAKELFSYSYCGLAICEKMAEDYEKLFNKKFYIINTGSSFEKCEFEKKNKISYIGNLGCYRDKQLVNIGKALKNNAIVNKVDVYSQEIRPSILENMTEENGIVFHGAIDSQKVNEVISESLAVLHIESFDRDMKKRVAYSVSTKIADSLASGTCLIAYGPGDIASIDYLIKNNCAYTITDDDDLEKKLNEIITNEELRDYYVKNALNIAGMNHNKKKNAQYLKKIMDSAAKLISEDITEE